MHAHAPNVVVHHPLGGALRNTGISTPSCTNSFQLEPSTVSPLLSSHLQDSRIGLNSTPDLNSMLTFPPLTNRMVDGHAHNVNTERRPFVDAVRPLNRAQHSQPVQKGEFLSINIDDHIHQQGVRELQNTLIGRMLLKKGVKPMSTTDLKAFINNVWNIQGLWYLVPLGKGYFNIRMENMMERDKIFKRRSWSTEFGNFRLQH